MPKISVIVPVYKVEPYLRRCVDSILAQTFKDFELILVDDGSPDSSPDICDEYKEKDSRIKVIHKTNGGVSSARNVGLSVAEGEYVTFIDSDDWVMPGFLEQFTRSNADLICQTGIFIDETGRNSKQRNITDRYIERITKNDLLELVLDDTLGYTWAKMYKRSLIEMYHLCFDSDLDFKEDLLFTIQYASHIQTILCENVSNYCYVVYKVNRQSLCSNITVEKFKDANRKVSYAIYNDSEYLSNWIYCKMMKIVYQHELRNVRFTFRRVVENYKLIAEMMDDEDFLNCCKQESGILPKRIQQAVINKSKIAIFLGCLYHRVDSLKNRLKIHIVNSLRDLIQVIKDIS